MWRIPSTISLEMEDVAMRSFDFSPLFRSTVGFDQLAHAMDNLAAEPAPTYPPYNIEVTGEDSYRITMAVAGFGEENLDVQVRGNKLVISGRVEKEQDKDERTFLHHGIAERAFERQFSLADHITVASASVENGLLHIELAREIPEAMKPRSIQIGGKSSTKRIEKAAA
jgi:molecular chaperone IbpA